MTAKRNRLAPKKVENLIVIKENMEKVDDFVNNGGYDIKKTEKNEIETIVVEETIADETEETQGNFELEEEEVFYVDSSDTDDSEDEMDLDDK